MQFRGHSFLVHQSMSVSWDFYRVPFFQPSPPTRFLSITGHWNVSLPSSASLWKCLARSKVNIQQKPVWLIDWAPTRIEVRFAGQHSILCGLLHGRVLVLSCIFLLGIISWRWRLVLLSKIIWRNLYKLKTGTSFLFSFCVELLSIFF